MYNPTVKPEIDKVGFTLFTSFLSLILVSLSLFIFGQLYVNLASIFLIVSIVFLISFVFWENRIPWPALDLSLFKIWQFTGGIIS